MHASEAERPRWRGSTAATTFIGMRIRLGAHASRLSLLAAVALFTVGGCGRHGRSVTSPNRLGSLPARLQLLAVDRALSDSASRNGLGTALGGVVDEGVQLLLPGAPFIHGAAEARRALARYPMRSGWNPLHVELSADSSLATTHGALLRDGGGASPAKYLSAWRRTDAGWRLAVWVVAGGVPSLLLPPDSMTMLSASESRFVAQIANADRAFSGLAEREDAAVAFARFAPPDATFFPGSGDIARGPADIATRLRACAPATRWSWRPMFAAAAGSGDFGWTVGEAVIAARADGGATSYSTYLTIWRRQPDGSWRFVADAGNARPADR